MARWASKADFEEGGLYWPPYKKFPFFGPRATQLQQRFGQKTILVAGAGFGYLVEEGVALGLNIYGMEVSPYALAQASASPISSRMIEGDVLVAADCEAARAQLMPGNKKIDNVVTEDLLTCLSDSEITTAVANLRAVSSGNLLHIVTPLDDGGTDKDPGLTWKTLAEWTALLTPPDMVLSVQQVGK